jgi:hypothetical protein
MIVISINAKKPARIVRQIEQNLRAELPKVGRMKLRNVLERIRKKMSGEGKKVNYPVKWDNPKQRRAYFATDGFGKGIPYTRTGGYQQAWKVVQKENGFSLRNAKPQAKYIGGTSYGLGQSRIHQGRWRLLRDTVDEELDKLTEEVRDSLFVVTRRIVKETR